MEIKRIFSDMDGTLLDSYGQVTKENQRLIKQAKIDLTLVSARAPMEMIFAIKALNLTGLQVAFNGGLLYKYTDEKIKPIYQQPLKKDDAEIILRNVWEFFEDVSVSFYDLNQWYVHKVDEGIAYEQQITQQKPTVINDLEVFLNAKEKTFKIMLISFDETRILKLEKFLRKLALKDVAIQRSGQAYLEITHKLAKKSTGVSYIMEIENLLRKQTAAFGDGHNDLPMLELVGYPIVMANATEEIKKIAYKITKTNDQSGVGYGINEYLR